MNAIETAQILTNLEKRLPPSSRIVVSFYVETDMKERAYKAAKALAEEVGGQLYAGVYAHHFSVEKDGEHIANICWTVPQEVSVSRED